MDVAYVFGFVCFVFFFTSLRKEAARMTGERGKGRGKGKGGR